eukprot:9952834-Heterocapsa_arctica.AAC.1
MAPQAQQPRVALHEVDLATQQLRSPKTAALGLRAPAARAEALSPLGPAEAGSSTLAPIASGDVAGLELLQAQAARTHVTGCRAVGDADSAGRPASGGPRKQRSGAVAEGDAGG